MELKARYSDLDFLSFESAYEVAENGRFRISDKKVIFEDGHHSRIFESEHNKIKTIETKFDTVGIDTPEDLERARQLLSQEIAK